ncbi:fructose-6-phosphate aldolase [Hujiaoplasma nucleasis]|uniref:Fructose-6-phosphate aldolase n=1 Tax=Hujiaoplasma nucleasis TaxID=2725268 RepID=A0A7L6N8P1_9MOLU|nr:fructose-6-phosphate aldolase [Hujiaoplasma nucleasis]QLY40924.1 fructose-6-phosphate aldolase [Hujiaoplasma nucleasis]
MKIFADTAIIKEIEEVSQWGIISGVTTNPSLIAKSGITLEEAMKKIVDLVDGLISAEVNEGKADDMVKEARVYAKMHKNIVIKIPMTIEGVKAVKQLTSEGIKTNVTLVFSMSQALMAASAGATYVSPFMGRLDDLNNAKDAGFNLVKDIKDMFKTYHFKTEIIAASIRHLDHVDQSMKAGADIATIPYKVLKEMVEHELTRKGLKIFAEAGK